MRILMCHPDFFGVKYEINPWMNIKVKVDHKLAVTQWENLYQTILNCGAQVDLVKPLADWPDMPFTANAGLLYKNKIILAYFKHKERQGEMPHFKNWFTQAGFEIVNPTASDANYFEGAGDALMAGDYLFAGYGFRTKRHFYEEASYLDHNKLVYCELTDPYFYHLDTCFSPLTDKLAMWYPQAFTPDSQKQMAEKIEFIPIVEKEAKRFACNAVVIGKQVVLPTECPTTAAALKERGFTVFTCDMNEFLKAGGACKCLTLTIG